MKINLGGIICGGGAVAIALCIAAPANALIADPNSPGWTDFVIRSTPTINTAAPGPSTEFLITVGG